MKRKVIIQRGEEPDFFMHEFEMEGGQEWLSWMLFTKFKQMMHQI